MPDVDGVPIHVTEGLADAGNQLNTKVHEFVEDLDALKKELAPLAEAWTNSKAAGYYQGLQQEWNIGAEGLFGPDGVLGRIAHAMHINWGNYSDAEWSNIRTWQH